MARGDDDDSSAILSRIFVKVVGGYIPRNVLCVNDTCDGPEEDAKDDVS